MEFNFNRYLAVPFSLSCFACSFCLFPYHILILFIYFIHFRSEKFWKNPQALTSKLRATESYINLPLPFRRNRHKWKKLGKKKREKTGYFFSKLSEAFTMRIDFFRDFEFVFQKGLLERENIKRKSWIDFFLDAFTLLWASKTIMSFFTGRRSSQKTYFVPWENGCVRCSSIAMLHSGPRFPEKFEKNRNDVWSR